MPDVTTTGVPDGFVPDRADPTALRALATHAAEAAGLDPHFVDRLITTESNWNPNAVSKKGAVGLMQLLPSTANENGDTDLHDPAENIKAGIAHLQRLSAKYPNRPDLVAAAYNAGEGTVDNAGGIPNIAATKQYVQKVAAPAPEGFVPDGFEPDAKVQVPMNQARVNGQDVPVEPDGPISRFVSGAAEYLNPITAVQGLWNAAPIPQALGGSGVIEGPTRAAKAVWDASAAEFAKAQQMAREGRYWEAVGHLGGALPLIGPAAARAGETIGSGDIAGGLGQAAGLLAPVLAPTALAGARTAVGAAREMPGVSGAMNAAATMAERASTENMTRAIAPQVGANKVRFGNTAAKVAPDLARDPELGAFSRRALADKIGAKLEEARAGLDAASEARLSARTFPTQPIIQELEAKRARLTANAVEGSQFPRDAKTPPSVTRAQQVQGITGELTPDEVASAPKPIGADVVPAPNAARVAQIDRAISELKQLGSVARYEPIRRIREAYDQVAKVKYNPAVTADFLAKQGEASGAADVTGVLRDRLAKMDPETAKANGPYALYKSAHDVLQAAEETDRVRPSVGRTIMARLVGGMAGEAAGGLPGAIAGTLLGPVIDNIAQMAPTLRIGYARALARLADALSAGEVGKAQGAALQLKAMQSSLRAKRVVTGNALNELTSPSGLQTQTTGSR